MPFTLAHPLAVIPCTKATQRGSLIFSALILGSMTADFPYFLGFQGQAHSYGHTIPGVFVFDVPAGLLTLWIMHGILKFPLLTLFPVSHQERLIPVARGFRFWPLSFLARTVVSLLLGVTTHLVWDSFTHDSGWPVQQFPNVLGAFVTLPRLGRIEICDLLQYGSSISGVLLLALLYYQWFRGAPRLPIRPELVLPERTRLLLLCGIGANAALLGFLYGYQQAGQLAGAPFHGEWLKFLIRYSVIWSLSVMVVELVVYSVLWRAFIMRKRSQWRNVATS